MDLRLSEFLSFRGEGACFLIPAFMRGNGDEVYAQQVDQQGCIEKFTQIRPEQYVRSYSVPLGVTKNVGDLAVFAVRFRTGDIVSGSFNHVRHILRQVDLDVLGAPFFNIDAQAFIGDFAARETAVERASKLFSRSSVRRVWQRVEGHGQVSGLLPLARAEEESFPIRKRRRKSRVAPSEADVAWAKTSEALKQDLGDATFQSWLGQAAVEERGADVFLVSATALARDWVRRHAWRRIGELWAQNDPSGRRIVLESRMEAEAAALARAQTKSAQDPGGDLSSALRGRGRLQGLQERFSFDSFVSGPSNEFAYAVARRVASWADGHFNPVIFHGPYGFGKSHLLQAIGWEAIRREPFKRVVYLTAERFAATFAEAEQEAQIQQFRDDLRGADLLLLDDVHFVGGKTNTQRELSQTLIALVTEGRRAVMTADLPPQDMSDLDPGLRSQLQAGLVCSIEPADRTLRLGIVERKLASLARQGGSVSPAPPAVMQFLADGFPDSVRELEGALNVLVARTGGDLSRLTADEAAAILRPHLAAAGRKVTVDSIQKTVAEHYNLKQADLISERRGRAVARARQVAMWLSKQITTRSLPDIGRRFGGRDHTTVLHAVRRIDALRQEDPAMARDLDTLLAKLGG